MSNRRDFFRKTGQLSVLAFITVGTAFLITENRVDLNVCSENTLCNNCRKLKTCSLDDAIKFRKNE